jgi:hypothetical protein
MAGVVAYVVLDRSGSGSPLLGAQPAVTSADLSSATPSTDNAAILADAVRAPAPKQVITWADGKADAAAAWAEPRVRGVERFAGRYEPQMNLRLLRKGYGDEAQLQLSLGRHEAAPSPSRSQVSQLGFLTGNTPVAARKKGHWFLFAAGGGNAVGVNLLRDPSGEIRRAGWSSERLAAVGSGQVGLGWRKGSIQASLGVVERELSTFGHSANEKFLAFTISISGGSGPHVSGGRGGNRAWLERDDGYSARHR